MVNKTLIYPLYFILLCILPTQLVAKNSIQEQIDRLELTQVTDPLFAKSMHLLQKKNYEAKDWGYFFGLTSFLNTNEINIDVKSKQTRIALEMLALAKLCRFGEAMAVAESAEVSLVELPIIKKAKKVVILQKEYELQRLKGKSFKKIPLLVKDKNYWPVTKKQIQKINHPRNIRKVVKSQCVI